MSQDEKSNKLDMDIEPKNRIISENQPGTIEIRNDLGPDNVIIVTDKKSLTEVVNQAVTPFQSELNKKLSKTEFDTAKAEFATNTNVTAELNKKANVSDFDKYKAEVDKLYQRKADSVDISNRVDNKLDKSVFDTFKDIELPRDYTKTTDLTKKLNQKVDLSIYQQEIAKKANTVDLDNKLDNAKFESYKTQQETELNKKATSQSVIDLKATLNNDYLTKANIENKLDLKADKQKVQQDLDKKADKSQLTNFVSSTDYNTFKQQIQTDVNNKLTQTDKTEILAEVNKKLPLSEFQTFQNTVNQELGNKLSQSDKTDLESQINNKIGQQEYQTIREEINVLKSGKKEFGSINKSKTEVDANLELLTNYVRDILKNPKAPMVDGYSVNTNDGYSYIYISDHWAFNGQDIIHTATLTTPGTIKLSNDNYKAGDGGNGTLKINGLLELVNKVNRLETGRVSLEANNTFTGLNKFTSNLTLEAQPTADNHVARLYEIKSLENSVNRKFQGYTPTSTLNTLLNQKASLDEFNTLKTSVDNKVDNTALEAYATKAELTQAKQSISSLETSKAEKTDITTINTEITNLKSGKANKTDHDALKGKVDQLSASQVKASDFNAYKQQVTQSLEAKLDKTDYLSHMQSLQTEVNKIATNTTDIGNLRTELTEVKETSDINKQDLDGIKTKVALLQGSVITLGSINKTKAEVEANKQLLTDRVTELKKTLVPNIVLYTIDKAEFIYNGTEWEFLKQDGVVEASVDVSGTIKFNAGNALGSIVAGPNGTAKVAGFYNLRSDIVEAQGNITTIKADVTQIKNDLGQATTNITTITTKLTNEHYTKNQLDPILNDKVERSEFNTLSQSVDSKLDASALTSYVKQSELNATNAEINKLKTGKANTSTVTTLTQRVDNLDRDKATKAEVTAVTNEVNALKTSTVKQSDFNTYKSEVETKLNQKLDASIENTLNQKINSKVSQEAHDRLVNEVSLLSRGKRELGKINKTKAEITANKNLLTEYVKTLLGNDQTPKEGYSINTSDGFSFIYVGSEWVDNGQDIINTATRSIPGTLLFKNADGYIDLSGSGDGTAIVSGYTEFKRSVTEFKNQVPTFSGSNTFTGSNTFNTLTLNNAPTDVKHVVRKQELDDLKSQIETNLNTKVGVEGDVEIKGAKRFVNGIGVGSDTKLENDGSGNLFIGPSQTGKMLYFESLTGKAFSSIDLKETVILKGVKDAVNPTDGVNKRQLDNAITTVTNSINTKANNDSVVHLQGKSTQEIKGNLSVYENGTPLKLAYDTGENTSTISIGEKSASGGYTEKFKLGKKIGNEDNFYFEASATGTHFIFNRMVRYDDANMAITHGAQLTSKKYVDDQINTRVSNTDFDALKSTVEGHTNTLSTINTKFDSYVPTSTFQELKTKVDTISSSYLNISTTSDQTILGHLIFKSDEHQANFIEFKTKDTRTGYIGHASTQDRHLTIRTDAPDSFINLSNSVNISGQLQINGNHIKMGYGGGVCYLSAEDSTDKTLHMSNPQGSGKLQIDMHGRKILNLGNASSNQDAVAYNQLLSVRNEIVNFMASMVGPFPVGPDTAHLKMALYGSVFDTANAVGTSAELVGNNIYEFRTGRNTSSNFNWDNSGNKLTSWGTQKTNQDSGNSYDNRTYFNPTDHTLFVGNKVLRFDFPTAYTNNEFTISIRIRHFSNPTNYRQLFLFTNDLSGSNWKNTTRVEWAGNNFNHYNFDGRSPIAFSQFNIREYHTLTLAVKGRQSKAYVDGQLSNVGELDREIGNTFRHLLLFTSRAGDTYGAQTEIKCIRLWNRQLNDTEVYYTYVQDLKL